MAILIFIIILVVIIYFYSFNNRDRNFDYKLDSEYQKAGNDDKLKTDIIVGIETTIKNDIVKNLSDAFLINSAIKNFVEKRQFDLLNNIESLSKQYKISSKTVKNSIFLACNYVRAKHDISLQSDTNTVKKPKPKKTKSSLSESISFTKMQKLACNAFLGNIIRSSYKENPNLYELYRKVDRSQHEFLGLSPSETTDYLEWAQRNRSSYLDTLETLNNTQKDFLVSMAVEFLSCNGLPTQDEYMKFEKSFEKFLSMSKEEFAERIIKINAVINKFS